MKRFQQLGAPAPATVAAAGETLIDRSRSWSTAMHVGVIAGLSALSFLLGIAALFITPAGTGVAIWWPAAGVGALLALLYRGPRWQVLLLVSAVGLLSNLAVGRPLAFALTASVILVVELVVFLAVLGPQSGGARL